MIGSSHCVEQACHCADAGGNAMQFREPPPPARTSIIGGSGKCVGLFPVPIHGCFFSQLWGCHVSMTIYLWVVGRQLEVCSLFQCMAASFPIFGQGWNKWDTTFTAVGMPRDDNASMGGGEGSGGVLTIPMLGCFCNSLLFLGGHTPFPIVALPV